jgi:DNA gyrase subunit A
VQNAKICVPTKHSGSGALPESQAFGDQTPKTEPYLLLLKRDRRMQRPDLSNLDPEIIAYIEFLEKKAGVRSPSQTGRDTYVDVMPERASETLPVEQETNINLITISHDGVAKRTLRHLYTRQHRGGMGVFGMDIDLPDYPVLLSSTEENQNLLFFTNRARVFRQPAQIISTNGVFAHGASIRERFTLESDETIVTVLPEQAKGYVALVSESGRLRCLRHHLFGVNMRPGTSLYNYNDFGPLAAACWTPGDAELFIVTQEGIGIRFGEKAISPQGDQAIRVSAGDRVVGIASIYDDSSVFMISADGRGALRAMSGFSANKSPGGSGKIAIKSSKVVSAATIDVNDDIFIISRLGKMIRFPADEVPVTEGVVQGVNCMSLRGDEVIAMIKNGPIY